MSDMNPTSVEEISQSIRAGLNIIERNEFSNTIRAIASIAASTVAKTLGPYAKTTIIDDGNFTYPTKDGWTVLSRMTFPDPVYQSIFKTIRGTSFRIVEAVGDGTTTAMVTSNHFINAMTEAIEAGDFANIRQADIVAALKSVKNEICDEIEKMAVPVHHDDGSIDYDAIYNVAYIASNGNARLAKVMQKIYIETGNPNVLVDLNGTMTEEIDYEIQRGYRFDCRPLLINAYVNTSEGYFDSKGAPCVFVIFDHNLSYNKHAEMLNHLIQYTNNLKASTGVNHMLVVMAPHFDDLISSSIMTVINENLKQDRNGIPGVMLIQIADLVRQDQKNFMNDFAAICNLPITNATTVKIFNEFRHNENVTSQDEIAHDKAMDLDEYKHFTTAQQLLTSCCGIVTDILIGKSFVTATYIDKDSVRYRKALEEATTNHKEAVEEAKHSTTTLMKNLMTTTDRLNRLSGNIGIIHIGGSSDLEKQCTMDIVDDTFRACRSAYENGVVPGLNMGTMVAIKRADENHTHSATEKMALRILRRAYKQTTADVLRNKYPDDTENVWTVEFTDNVPHGQICPSQTKFYMSNLELIDALVQWTANGSLTAYDIVNERVCVDRIPSVLNSASTDIEILNGVISVLSLILTSDQYLSVSRFYDKTATAKMQEAANARMLANDTRAILDAVDKYLITNTDSKIGKLIGVVSQLIAPKPVETAPFHGCIKREIAFEADKD